MVAKVTYDIQTSKITTLCTWVGGILIDELKDKIITKKSVNLPQNQLIPYSIIKYSQSFIRIINCILNNT